MPRTQQLGRYHLLDRLACGGMAEVFRARTFDSEGRAYLVANNRVLPHLTEDDEFITMLVDEAKLAGLLHHPNIAQVYELAQVGTSYFLAMEYVDGKDLRSLLDRAKSVGEQLPPVEVAYVGAEVCEALDAAHTQRDRDGTPLRLVHRDISPSNVLCSYDGHVKLCDFGIAKAVGTRVQTRAGVIKGKVKYMSPEQAMGRKLDARSDLFSLGVVLYELLTNQAPFQAQGEMELIFAVRDARYAPIRDLNPAVPPRLCAVVDRALTRSRSARWQTAREFGAALREFLGTERPHHARSRLARLLRRLFAREIESDLRRLEDWIVESGPATADAMGVNLIADVLGDEAAYSRFTPMAPPAVRQTGSRAGTEFDLFSADTLILHPRGLTSTAPAPDFHQADTNLIPLPGEGKRR
jgi:serine/threonine protein kinase